MELNINQRVKAVLNFIIRPFYIMGLPKVRRDIVVFDIECYRNYLLICFKHIKSGKRMYFELTEHKKLDTKKIINIISNYTLVGFNSMNYDIPVLKAALKYGVDNSYLKGVNDHIIMKGSKYWQTEKVFNLPKLPKLDHIDIIEPMPSVGVSLKLYGGRLHSQRLQDLPVDPMLPLTDDDIVGMVKYCWNDVDTTEDCYNHIIDQLELRYQISEMVGSDMRSKGDAQIAEAIIKYELTKAGTYVQKPDIPMDYEFKYTPPGHINFKTETMNDVFDIVKDATFKLKKKETTEKVGEGEEGIVKIKISGIDMPKEIKKCKINIGNSTYKLGIGGLHSTEKAVSYYSDEEGLVEDDDVVSYYPALMINERYYPKHLGESFIDIFGKIRDVRVEAKRIGDNIKNKTYKIVLNGTFGKMGSKYSFLYSPDLMVHVTMSGQLSLLMLIEDFELNGIPVLSANTDGIVTKCPHDKVELKAKLIKDWEHKTGLEMENSKYASIHSANVNNYIAVNYDGSVKQKGLYAFVGSKGFPSEKNPQANVCIDAVIAFIKSGTAPFKTITSTDDVTRFIKVRKVTGGAEYKGENLGKVVRWVHSMKSNDQISYVKNGNKVPTSDGAVPMMNLPIGNTVPDYINVPFYENKAITMIESLGLRYERI